LRVRAIVERTMKRMEMTAMTCEHQGRRLPYQNLTGDHAIWGRDVE
jgi:hypothetical protein